MKLTGSGQFQVQMASLTNILLREQREKEGKRENCRAKLRGKREKGEKWSHRASREKEVVMLYGFVTLRFLSSRAFVILAPLSSQGFCRPEARGTRYPHK